MKKLHLSVIVLVFSLLLCSCAQKRTDFIIDYTPTGVEKFLNIVCRNYNGDYAKVIDPNYDGPAGDSCYTAEVEVKPVGRVAETVQMRFYNGGYSDKVSFGKVIFYSSDSENEFDCRKEFVVALEKALSGTTYVQDYIDSQYSISSFASTLEGFDSALIAEYQLTDNLLVEISCDPSLMNEWYLIYTITIV